MPDELVTMAERWEAQLAKRAEEKDRFGEFVPRAGRGRDRGDGGYGRGGGGGGGGGGRRGGRRDDPRHQGGLVFNTYGVF